MYITHNTRSTDSAPAQPSTIGWARSGLEYSRTLVRRQFAPQGPALLVVIGSGLALVLIAVAVVLAVRRSRATCCGCRRAGAAQTAEDPARRAHRRSRSRTADLVATASPGAGRADTKGPQVRQVRVRASFPFPFPLRARCETLTPPFHRRLLRRSRSLFPIPGALSKRKKNLGRSRPRATTLPGGNRRRKTVR